MRAWVRGGGAFVGVGEPSSAPRFQTGRFFQLADVIGVDEERYQTLSVDKYFPPVGAGPLHHRRCAGRPGGPARLRNDRLPHPAERLRRRPVHQAVGRHRFQANPCSTRIRSMKT